MLKIKLHFYALYRDLTGERVKHLEVKEGITLEGLKEEIENHFPQLKGHPLIMAVNGEYKDSSSPLKDGDEVSLLPPFSGGLN
jgi:MoaD family protein